MLKMIGIALLVCIVLVLALAAMKPSTFRVERTTVIAASPEKIAPLIADFHNWASWSPWQHLDPNMTMTFSGAHSGPGAVYEWEGNSKAGKGRMEILGATPTQTDVDVVFVKPFPGKMLSTFTPTPVAGGTQVSWVMTGEQKFFPSKVMAVFVSMDKMIGGDFERGLANMKRVAEQ